MTPFELGRCDGQVNRQRPSAAIKDEDLAEWWSGWKLGRSDTLTQRKQAARETYGVDITDEQARLLA